MSPDASAPHRRRLLQATAALGVAAALPAKAVTPRPVADDMSMGNPNARVTVIEYGSASCPHCAHFNNEVFPAFKAQFIDTGQVRYIFREYLTPPIEFAAASFLIARCAGKDKYFSVIDAVFRAQDQIYKTGEAGDALIKIAKDAGLSEDAANACLDDKAALDALNARVQTYETRDKIEGTPTFFVNDQRLDGGQTLAALAAAVRHAEAKAGHPVRGH